MNSSKKTLTILSTLLLTFVIASSVFAMKAEYNYMNAASLQKAVENKADIAIVDIQVSEEFKNHHIKGAIETCAYPVKSVADRAKFDATLKQLKNSAQPIVVICPRGKGGAERTVNYFTEQGIAPYRIFILTEGQAAWPYSVEKK
ncbi:rhodanese-like domain-containing protein [Maridesulfovibrio hydrothermalis]|uniref:ThiF n=1 Tax=Maridesulfovibrio hydrothermalis AM13 = DSM 14728 TaxID=1121451 RepID=L0RCB5_9BACT|nr:rhodanese-like domain-containing protein [Maridesulfovibrio hydrothermalis]CCO23862.1 ThiF [Maridesulfovibrio hydrothermalis AM13 = DSM 14728]